MRLLMRAGKRRRTAQLENANANLRRANKENERIAAALGRSEARLRLINDTIPILIGYVDQNEVYQYANKGYSDWYGHPEGGEAIWRQFLGTDSSEELHRAAHRSFGQEIARIRSKLDSQTGKEVAEEALAYLAQWLASHILESDRYMAYAVDEILRGPWPMPAAPWPPVH